MDFKRTLEIIFNKRVKLDRVKILSLEKYNNECLHYYQELTSEEYNTLKEVITNYGL